MRQSTTAVKSSVRNRKYDCQKDSDFLELINQFPRCIAQPHKFKDQRSALTYCEIILKVAETLKPKEVDALCFYENDPIEKFIYDIEEIIRDAASEAEVQISFTEDTDTGKMEVTFFYPIHAPAYIYDIEIDVLNKIPNDILKIGYAYFLKSMALLNDLNYYGFEEKDGVVDFKYCFGNAFQEIDFWEDDPDHCDPETYENYQELRQAMYGDKDISRTYLESQELLHKDFKLFQQYVPKNKYERKFKNMIISVVDFVETFYENYFVVTDGYGGAEAFPGIMFWVVPKAEGDLYQYEFESINIQLNEGVMYYCHPFTTTTGEFDTSIIKEKKKAFADFEKNLKEIIQFNYEKL